MATTLPIVAITPALSALALTIPVAISTTEFMARPTTHRAITFLALILVLLGHASSLFLSCHLSDHRAYLVSISTSTFGACCLVVASIVNLWRLLLRVLDSSDEKRGNGWGMSPCGVISVLGLLQTAAMACLALGSVYLAIVHSASPMQGLSDVMARIESGERSRSALLAGYILQVVVLVVFEGVLVGVWRWIPLAKPGALDVMDGGEEEVEVRRCVRRAYFSLGVTVGSVAVRTLYYLIELLSDESSGMETASTSTVGLFLNLAPIFCACWGLLGQGSLNTADEMTETQLSGWPGNEKERSSC